MRETRKRNKAMRKEKGVKECEIGSEESERGVKRRKKKDAERGEKK